MIDEKGNFISKKLTDPILTYKGYDSGPTVVTHKFYFEGEFYGDSKSKIPGYREWSDSRIPKIKNSMHETTVLVGTSANSVKTLTKTNVDVSVPKKKAVKGISSNVSTLVDIILVGSDLINTDFENHSEVEEFTKNTITAAASNIPTVGVPVGFLLNDARTPDGITNLDNGKLADVYSTGVKQTQAQNNSRIKASKEAYERAQKANKIRKKKEFDSLGTFLPSNDK